nr:Metallophosphatase [Oceanusvirus sp.]
MLQVLSDVHLEARRVATLRDFVDPCAENLVLAGDIGDPGRKTYSDFIEQACQSFRRVFVVPGNHEYYGRTLEEGDGLVREACAARGAEVLQGSRTRVDGVDLVGATLWSRVDAFDRSAYEHSDHVSVREFTPRIRNDIHTRHAEFLRWAVTREEPVVVVTHHLPSFSLVADEYRRPFAKNDMWASACDDIVKRASAWIYGHTHAPSRRIAFGVCETVCNPVGYPDETSRHDRRAVLNIDRDALFHRMTANAAAAEAAPTAAPHAVSTSAVASPHSDTPNTDMLVRL